MTTPIRASVFAWAAAVATSVFPLAVADAASATGEVVRSGSYELPLPLGLQADSAYIPDSNPLSAAKIELGRMLYFDGRLSKNGNVPCAACHNPYHGFADPDPTSVGVGFARGGRNSPTIINRLFSAEQFWDGRAEDLEAQAKGPLTNPIEMAMPSHDAVVKVVRGIKGYGPLFEKAYGSADVDIDRIAKAIASYERIVLSGNSPYDRHQAGEEGAMSAQQIRGMELFRGKANCETCHVSFNFTDENYHNIGVGWDGTKLADAGLADRTKKDADRGKFKTPTLRNIAESGPYMHDGSERTLTEVVEFYNRGGKANPTLSDKIKPLGLTPVEIADVVAFMHALTGEVTGAEPPASLPE